MARNMIHPPFHHVTLTTTSRAARTQAQPASSLVAVG
jgi:hypothetical protein